MIRRAEDFSMPTPAEGAAFVEISERAALLARLMALDEGVEEGDFIEELIAERAREVGLAGLVGRGGHEGELPDGGAE